MSTVLRAPSLGPIIGHVTATTARVWIRGHDADDDRTIGVAALFAGGIYVPDSARYFRLRREYDRTGVVDFTALIADTRYNVGTGCLALETPDPLLNNTDAEVFSSLPPANGWVDQLQKLDADEAGAQFTTFPAATLNQLSFIFGSCRYPGLLWTKKRADVIFRCIYERFSAPAVADKPRFFMMVGDQIYADTLPKDLGLVVANSEAEFSERYLSAFGAPNTRKLLQNVPTYMILDDHEIEDNWVQGRLHQASKRHLFNLAIQAYRSYQWYHGPRNFGDYLYYSFVCAGFSFFVLDERTQRIRDDNDCDLSDNYLLGRPDKGSGYKGQIDYLIDWLIEQQKNNGDRPKFIVSASVFVPNDVGTVKNDRAKCDNDAWAAYPNTRKQLLQAVLANNIQNIVFLSGDIHCSNIAEMWFVSDNGGAVSPLRAFSITSSAFYWPYPFADGNPLDYVHDSNKEGDNFDIENGWSLRYNARNFQQDDNFTQVDVDWAGKALIVRNFGKGGEALDSNTIKLA